MRTELFSAVTDSSVTLWWDQPDQAPFPARYAVLLGGKPAGVTERTHFTAEGLSTDTAYCFQVCLGGELIGETTVRTAKLPRRIDVTKAPYLAVGDGKVTLYRDGELIHTAAFAGTITNFKVGDVIGDRTGIENLPAATSSGDVDYIRLYSKTVDSSIPDALSKRRPFVSAIDLFSDMPSNLR